MSPERPPPAVFRAFYEHSYALIAQLFPVFKANDVDMGQEFKRLLMQMKKDAAVDGVYDAHMTKMVTEEASGD